jgi:hypothetical protein
MLVIPNSPPFTVMLELAIGVRSAANSYGASAELSGISSQPTRPRANAVQTAKSLLIGFFAVQDIMSLLRGEDIVSMFAELLKPALKSGRQVG